MRSLPMPAATLRVAPRSAAPLPVVRELAPPPILAPSPVLGPETIAPSGRTNFDALAAPASAPAPAKRADLDRGDGAEGASEPVLAPAKNVQRAPGPTPAETSPRASPDMGATGALEPAPADAPVPRPKASELAAELDLLHQVHAALRARHADRALALLDRWGRSVGPRPLDEEAEAARVSALCQLGRDSDARVAIERFVAQWPGSPLAARLQGGCAAPDANAGDPRN